MEGEIPRTNLQSPIKLSSTKTNDSRSDSDENWMYQMQLTFFRENLALLKQEHCQHINELNQ